MSSHEKLVFIRPNLKNVAIPSGQHNFVYHEQVFRPDKDKFKIGNGGIIENYVFRTHSVKVFRSDKHGAIAFDQDLFKIIQDIFIDPIERKCSNIIHNIEMDLGITYQQGKKIERYNNLPWWKKLFTFKI